MSEATWTQEEPEVGTICLCLNSKTSGLGVCIFTSSGFKQRHTDDLPVSCDWWMPIPALPSQVTEETEQS